MALLTVPAVPIETAGQNEPLKTSFYIFFCSGLLNHAMGSHQLQIATLVPDKNLDRFYANKIFPIASKQCSLASGTSIAT